MTWVAAGSAAVGLVGSLVSANASKPQKVRLQPYNLNTPFGDFSMSGGKDTVKGLGQNTGFDTTLADLFKQYGQSNLGAAAGLTPETVGAQPFDLQSMSNLSGPSGAGSFAGSDAYSTAGQTALSALGNFDPNAAAASAYDKMTALTRPDDQNAAQSLATRLFSRGRLGGNDTASGTGFRNLALAQSQAADSRALSAYSLANQDATRLGTQANQFGTLGSNMASTNATNLGNIFGMLRGDQYKATGQVNDLRTALGTGAAGASTSTNSIMDQFLNFVKQSQGGQTGQIPLQTAQIAGQNAWANTNGNVLGGIFSGIAPAAGTAFGNWMNAPKIGGDATDAPG